MVSASKSAMLSKVSEVAKFNSSKSNQSPFLTALTKEPSTKLNTKELSKVEDCNSNSLIEFSNSNHLSINTDFSNDFNFLFFLGSDSPSSSGSDSVFKISLAIFKASRHNLITFFHWPLLKHFDNTLENFSFFFSENVAINIVSNDSWIGIAMVLVFTGLYPPNKSPASVC
ncbi:uncharacterized protein SPAPADRAFT_141833 [Spathaspora passalidarum NRRL Y-27907]|uniref:Uncharacterized protein n=1 Tax=Spathaspora passalidarum (strain NRRL Y-27907 / 11-Y1) TaxID=619300 RepID=G3ASV4_SPAPN|nr:uncharacterized protein SPAPADRAFT_141833 [Spathaspora passalidarum NRRL Y-27907]EGW30736.1 hypothetical protein SPAPADRAFT_141833 [Spathaspora passalidarum NRRL Y-27907]